MLLNRPAGKYQRTRQAGLKISNEACSVRSGVIPVAGHGLRGRQGIRSVEPGGWLIPRTGTVETIDVSGSVQEPNTSLRSQFWEAQLE